MTRQQKHKYRCETCAFGKMNKERDFCECSKAQQIILPSEIQLINSIGCASNSSAGKAEQRIKDVIKELECLAKEEDDKKREGRLCNEAWMGHTYANSAYLKALALLRGKEE